MRIKKSSYILICSITIFSIIPTFFFFIDTSSKMHFDSTIETKMNDFSVYFPKTSGVSQFSDIGDYLYLENDYLNISFKKSLNCGINSFIEKFTGNDYCNSSGALRTLFAFRFYNSSYEDIFFQWDAINLDYGIKPINDGLCLELNYSSFSNIYTEEYDIDVFISIEIYDREKLTDWSINISNNAPITIKEILFPFICGVSGQVGSKYGDEYLLYPKLDGVILHCPNKTIDQYSSFTGTYPSDLSMQFMAYGDELNGLYVATYDNKGFIKRFGFDRDYLNANSLLIYISHLISELEGNDFNPPFIVKFGFYDGDWRAAADIYKNWGIMQPWASKGTVDQRNDLPSWWKKTAIIEIENYDDNDLSTPKIPLSEFNIITKSISDMTGLNITTLFIGWEQNGSWIGPNAFPPREGNASFISAIDSLKNDGNHGFIYLSGTIWRVERPDLNPPYNGTEYFLNNGIKWVAINATNEPYYDEFYSSLGWKAARMCVATDKWREYVINNSIKAVELGLDALSIDEFPVGSIYPCYNDTHGHPLGYGKYQPDHYKIMLEDIRLECRNRNPNFIMSMEQANEIYIPYVDTYVSRDNAPEYLIYKELVNALGNTIEFPSLFTYIYHEYLTTFGEMLPIHNYSSSLFYILYNQHARSLGENFVRGKIQNAKYGNSTIIVPELIELYNRTAQAIGTYGNKYFIEGKMLKAPKIIVPEINITWLYSYQPLIYGPNLTSPAILHSAWQSPDNCIGYAFVNLKDETINFNINISDYDLSYSRYILKKTKNGIQEILYINTELPITISLSLGFNDVVIIEVIPYNIPIIFGGSKDSKSKSKEKNIISVGIAPLLLIALITILMKMKRSKKKIIS
ncbi:MAG: DUF6259 domain-containing protein [Promethearchaeota archaeon]